MMKSTRSPTYGWDDYHPHWYPPHYTSTYEGYIDTMGHPNYGRDGGLGLLADNSEALPIAKEGYTPSWNGLHSPRGYGLYQVL